MLCTKPIITIPTTSMNVQNATLTLFPWTSITSATSSCPLAEHRWLDEFDLRWCWLFVDTNWGELWWGFKLEQFTNKNVVKKWEYRMIPWLVNLGFPTCDQNFPISLISYDWTKTLGSLSSAVLSKSARSPRICERNLSFPRNRFNPSASFGISPAFRQFDWIFTGIVVLAVQIVVGRGNFMWQKHGGMVYQSRMDSPAAQLPPSG